MDKAHKETDKILAKLEKNIEELYSDALRELKSKLNTLISRIDTTKEPQQIYNQLQQNILHCNGIHRRRITYKGVERRRSNL